MYESTTMEYVLKTMHFENSHFADTVVQSEQIIVTVDQSELSIVTIDQSEQSIESADQSQNGILTKTVFGSSAGAGISLLLVPKPGVVVQEDSAGVHSEPRPGELRQAPGPRP